MDAHPNGLPPTPKIRALVESLTQRFPDLTGLSDEDVDSTDTPWASGPLMSEASGDFFYFPMTFPGAEAHLAEVLSIIQNHGLVCFDPQAEEVSPRPARLSSMSGVGSGARRPSLVARYPLLRLPIVFLVVFVVLFLVDKCSG